MFKKLLLVCIVSVFAEDIDAEIIRDIDFFINYSYIESDDFDNLQDLDDETLKELSEEEEE